MQFHFCENYLTFMKGWTKCFAACTDSCIHSEGLQMEVLQPEYQVQISNCHLGVFYLTNHDFPICDKGIVIGATSLGFCDGYVSKYT